MDDVIAKLAEVFGKFPGIGPRQAKRFVYFLLAQDAGYVSDLVSGIEELRSEVHQCPECYRYHMGERCVLCIDKNADQTTLLVVEKDADLESIKKTNKYRGRYFVLGGLLPILEEQPETKIRVNELKKRILALPELKEIILALSANPLGENTIDFLREEIAASPNIKVSVLGRGLSTGAELEYADSHTLTHALENRK